jgi:hypothetical protein
MTLVLNWTSVWAPAAHAFLVLGERFWSWGFDARQLRIKCHLGANTLSALQRPCGESLALGQRFPAQPRLKRAYDHDWGQTGGVPASWLPPTVAKFGFVLVVACMPQYWPRGAQRRPLNLTKGRWLPSPKLTDGHDRGRQGGCAYLSWAEANQPVTLSQFYCIRPKSCTWRQNKHPPKNPPYGASVETSSAASTKQEAPATR